VRAQATDVDHALGVGPGLARGRPPRQRADHHVVEDREVAERLDDLEGAGESQQGNRVGGLAGDVAPLQGDAPLVRAIVAADQVKERGLARAVGPDDAQQIARADLEAHVAHGSEAAEALGHVLEAEHDGAG
jgi:hypothetical protein